VRYFKLQDWPLDGRKISLYDLEHKVLRPLGDPRIHFAIICASRSCPFLRPRRTRPRLDAQLDDQARQFVNDPFRNRFDKATKTAHLSEIFKWFEEDFQGAGRCRSTSRATSPTRRREGPRAGRLQDPVHRLRLEPERQPATPMSPRFPRSPSSSRSSTRPRRCRPRSRRSSARVAPTVRRHRSRRRRSRQPATRAATILARYGFASSTRRAGAPRR
jgi:hypothetical protein